MILITSAAFVDRDFIAEFGRIPPAFLPVGNRRLYEHQLGLLADVDEPVFLSIPDQYHLDAADEAALLDRRVAVVRPPAGLSLGESVLFCVNATGGSPGPLRILHGDTLFTEVDTSAADVVSVGENIGYYDRATVEVQGDGRLLGTHTELTPDNQIVLAGWFSFSSAALLAQAIVFERGDFVRAVARYAAKCPLRMVPALGWLDFGHLNTFFRSRASMTTQRAFNGMDISPRSVRKWSTKKEKIAAEIAWFRDLPPDLRPFVPHLLRTFDDASRCGYSLEYLYLSPLNDLFVFGSLPASSWRSILGACREFLNACRSHAAPQQLAQATADLYLPKTLSRLEQFASKARYDIEAPTRLGDADLPSLVDIARTTASEIAPAAAEYLVLSHGDFGFNNILYDARACCIKVVDPRGIDARGTTSPYGDQRYDLAKLAHSVFGLYDVILAKRFRLRRLGERTYEFELHAPACAEQVQAIFREAILDGNTDLERQVQAINVHLFLSMLPLHDDDEQRQQALLANALRLYAISRHEAAPEPVRP